MGGPGYLTAVLSAVMVARLSVAASGTAETEALMHTCSACHGNDGKPISADTPIISGQPFTVIDDALILFARGDRPCTVMCAIADALAPREREELANELEQRAFVPAGQGFDRDLADLGAGVHQGNGCETCHSSGGRNGNGMAPVLAGQQTAYLREALRQIRAGERSGPEVMNRAVRSLSDDEIEALLNFYARNGHQD